jgi:hypothetical protein
MPSRQLELVSRAGQLAQAGEETMQGGLAYFYLLVSDDETDRTVLRNLCSKRYARHMSHSPRLGQHLSPTLVAFIPKYKDSMHSRSKENQVSLIVLFLIIIIHSIPCATGAVEGVWCVYGVPEHTTATVSFHSRKTIYRAPGISNHDANTPYILQLRRALPQDLVPLSS